MTRTRIWLAVLAVVLALLAYSRLGEHEESSAFEEQTAGATEEASRDATANGSVLLSEGDPLGSGEGRPTPGASRGRQGSSTAKGSRSTDSLPEGTISPGFEIAFTRPGRESGGTAQHSEIFLMNAEGSDLRFLRAGATTGWSPDGKLIAFDGGEFGGEIRFMNADGSGVQNLGVWGFSPTWSPDGGQLAFARECRYLPRDGCANGGTGFEDVDCGPSCGIGVVGRDGTGVRYLGTGMWPDWGPDGRILFGDGETGPCYYSKYTLGRPKTEPPCELPLWIINSDGSGRTRIPIDKAAWPTWSPDGRRIAYHTSGDGVFIANSDGTGVAKVAPAGYTQPSWSPDGLWLALTLELSSDYYTHRSVGAG